MENSKAQTHDNPIIKDPKELIKDNYGDLTEEHLVAYERVTEADIKKSKTEKLIDTWKEQQKSERELRQSIARWILIGLFVQFLIGNCAWFLIGFGLMEFNELVVNIFFVGMYTQLVTITLIVVKNLFPKSKQSNINDVNNIVKDL